MDNTIKKEKTFNKKGLLVTIVITTLYYFFAPYLFMIFFFDRSGEINQLIENLHPAILYTLIASIVYFIIPIRWNILKWIWVVLASILIIANFVGQYFYDFEIKLYVQQIEERKDCTTQPHGSISNYCKAYFSILKDRQLGSCQYVSLIPEEYRDYLLPQNNAGSLIEEDVKSYVLSGISGSWMRPPIINSEDIQRIARDKRKSEEDIFAEWQDQAMLSCMSIEHSRLLNNTTDCQSLQGYAKDVCLLVTFPDSSDPNPEKQNSFDKRAAEVCTQVEGNRMKEVCNRLQDRVLNFNKTWRLF